MPPPLDERYGHLARSRRKSARTLAAAPGNTRTPDTLHLGLASVRAHPNVSGVAERSRSEQELHTKRGEVMVDGTPPAGAADQTDVPERGQVLGD